MTSLYFAFCTRPTISMSSASPVRPLPMRLPTASRPRLNFFANASLTIATFGAPSDVGARELAARDERHAHRPEVAGADLVEAGVAVDVGPGLEALDLHVVAPVAAGEQRHERGRHAGDARQRRELVFEPLEQLARPLGRVGVELRRDAERDDVVDLEAEIDAADVEQALGEEARADEQRHRERDLRRRQRRAEALGRPSRPMAGPPGP